MSTIKSIIEFVPLVAFFIAYNYSGMMLATQVILIFTFVVLILQFVLWRHISWNNLLSASVLGVFGALTIYSGDSTFIKIKPTIIYCAFALILTIGMYYGKIFIKTLFNSSELEVDEQGWRFSTYLWIGFFMCAAAINELIWRNCEEATWVKFKVFGMLPLTVIFTILNVLIVYAYSNGQNSKNRHLKTRCRR